MFNRNIVKKALMRTWESDDQCGYSANRTADDSSSMTSQLIYDVFGGKILKICREKGWHFYNRIDGEPVDFTVSELDNYFADNSLEGQPASPEEIRKYYALEDYLAFYISFINSFEEIVGLKRQTRKTQA